MGLDETDSRKSSFEPTSYVFQKLTFDSYQSLTTRTVQRAHEVSVDSSSIVVVLTCGRFKGKSEATKSEISKDFFHFFLVLIVPFLVTLTKLEVRYLILLCSFLHCSFVVSRDFERGWSIR